jgi:hypothetical protein
MKDNAWQTEFINSQFSFINYFVRGIIASSTLNIIDNCQGSRHRGVAFNWHMGSRHRGL